MGLAVNYKNWVVKVDRSINNPLMEPPPEKINANSILFGYSFQPFQSVSEIYIIPKFGIGKVENMKRGKLINYSLTSYGFESILENGNSVAAEIDIELKLTRYIGFYLSSFANFNNIRNIYGFNSGIFSRYFLTAT